MSSQTNTARRKVVISGSSSLQKDIARWKDHFDSKGYDVIATPDTDFTTQLADVYRMFYAAIDACDVFFLMNEDKKGIEGYIGANATAELIYAVMLNLAKNRDIDIYIAKIPSEQVLAHDEVTNFLQAGWIRVYGTDS